MNTRNPPNDPLDDLFNSATNNVVPIRPAPRPAAANFVPVTERATPPQQYRPKVTAAQGGRRQGRTLGIVIEEWVHEHRAESEWMTEAARRNEERRGNFDFPQAMLTALAKYGSLTDNQLAAVRKCMARDAQRDEARARAADAEANTVKPVVDVTKLEAAFQRARDSAAQDREGLKFLHLRLDTFIFSPAGARSRNPGAIYVKENLDESVYLGKIQGGRFSRSGDCTDDQERRIVAAASDPATAAKAYGLRTGSCSICGRELTNRESINLGIGPICAARWGF
jgi:hypothetical protein